jgi:hypothetical protein
VTPKDLVATIYARLGIEPDFAFPDKVNRPIAIVAPGGEPIRELL